VNQQVSGIEPHKTDHVKLLGDLLEDNIIQQSNRTERNSIAEPPKYIDGMLSPSCKLAEHTPRNASLRANYPSFCCTTSMADVVELGLKF